MDSDQIGRLVYLGLLLAALGGWLMVEFRQRLGHSLRIALGWGLIFMAAMAGYGVWQDLRHDILPHQTVTQSGEVRVPRAADGHYYLRLTISGTEIPFLADTGATNVVLSPSDARSLGLDPENLPYLGEAMTANGKVRTARVTLPLVALGPFSDDNLGVWVNEADMQNSLLGMDYLGQFHIELVGDTMILRR